MKKVIQSVNRRTTLGVAAFLISGSYLASRALGLLRDRLLASHFGVQSPLTDAYTAAFRIPELLFTLLVSGAFAVAFIPVVSELIAKGKEEEAWEVSSGLMNLLALATIALGVVIFVAADPITRLITPGFDQFRHDVTVDLTRIFLITPFLFAVSSVFGSIQQTYNRFLFFALAGVFYNLGIIFGIVFLSKDFSIYGVAAGVVIGTLIQAGIQLIGLAGLGFRWRPHFGWRNPGVRRILKLMVPRSIDQGIDQLNYTVQTVIGSQLATGSLTAFYYANNLRNVPLAIFGSAIATAAFPRLAANAAKSAREKLIEDFVVNARLILFLVIPSATVAVLMRGYIVRLLFGFGNPTTASLLGWFAGSIIFHSLFLLVCRVYYALQDTRTPLFVSMFAIAANIILSFALSKKYGVAGLAMAQSLIAMAETVILLALLKLKLGSIGLWQIASGVGRMLIANAIMASAIYVLVSQVLPLNALDRGFVVIGPKFLAISVAGGLCYLLPSYFMQVKEAKMFVGKLLTPILRPLSLR